MRLLKKLKQKQEDTGFVYLTLHVGKVYPKEVCYWHGGGFTPHRDGQPGYVQGKAEPENGWGPEGYADGYSDGRGSYYAAWEVEGVTVRMKADLSISVPRAVYDSINEPPENEFGVVSL